MSAARLDILKSGVNILWEHELLTALQHHVVNVSEDHERIGLRYSSCGPPADWPTHTDGAVIHAAAFDQ